MTDNTLFPDPAIPLQAQQAALERRRALARSLIEQSQAQMKGPSGQMVSGIYVPNSALDSFVPAFAGSMMNASADKDAAKYATDEQAATVELLKRLGTTGTQSVEQAGPLPEDGTPLPAIQQPNTPEQEDARRLQVLGQGMAIPSLRKTIEAQMGQEMDAPRKRQEDALKLELEDKRERARAILADANATAAEKRQAALFEAQLKQIEARFAGQKQLKEMPNITVRVGNGPTGGPGKPPSGYRWGDDGETLEPITGGPADPKAKASKPLTGPEAKTQRSVMDLRSSLDAYEKLYKDYDPQGNAALSPAKRAQLETAFTDLQMRLKGPSVYDLGAPQAADLQLLAQSLDNPTSIRGSVSGAAFGKQPHSDKIGQIRRILDDSQANFEAQTGRKTPTAAGGGAPAKAQPQGGAWDASKEQRYQDWKARNGK